MIKHILTVDVVEFVTDNYIIERNLIESIEVKNEQQAYDVIKKYLQQFVEVEQISEHEKFNDIKFQYIVKNDKNLYHVLGFKLNNYEVKI